MFIIERFHCGCVIVDAIDVLFLCTYTSSLRYISGDLKCEIRNDTSCNTAIHCVYNYPYLPDVILDNETLDVDCAVFDKHCELNQLIPGESNLSAVIVLLRPQLLDCDKKHTIVIGWNPLEPMSKPCNNITMAINIAGKIVAHTVTSYSTYMHIQSNLFTTALLTRIVSL